MFLYNYLVTLTDPRFLTSLFKHDSLLLHGQWSEVEYITLTIFTAFKV